ncbi:MAG: hypothetical protein ABW185_00655 [Sedimenticola sp.]
MSRSHADIQSIRAIEAPADSSDEPPTDSTHSQLDEAAQTYLCPLCSKPAENGTIECGECEEWFHFE